MIKEDVLWIFDMQKAVVIGDLLCQVYDFRWTCFSGLPLVLIIEAE